jgi:hypothetical protein
VTGTNSVLKTVNLRNFGTPPAEHLSEKKITLHDEITQKLASERANGWVDNASLVPRADESFVDRVDFTSRGAARMAQNFYPVALRELSGPIDANGGSAGN